jgi:hypothetical protein
MSEPARRSAWRAYLWIWLTGGLFWFVWLHRSMRDLNTIHRRTVFDEGRIARWGVGGWLLYVIVLVLAVALSGQRSSLGQVLLLVGFLLAVVGMGVWAWLHVRIARAIAVRQLSTSGRGCVSPIAAGFLSWVLGLAVPYLQAHLNSIVTPEHRD